MPHLFAYLDPGSGSMLIQVAISMVAVVAAAPILLRNKIVNGWRARRHPVTPPEEETQNSDSPPR